MVKETIMNTKMKEKIDKILGIKGKWCPNSPAYNEYSCTWNHCGFSITVKTVDHDEYYTVYLYYKEPTEIELLFQSKKVKRVINLIKIIYEKHIKINPTKPIANERKDAFLLIPRTKEASDAILKFTSDHSIFAMHIDGGDMGNMLRLPTLIQEFTKPEEDKTGGRMDTQRRWKIRHDGELAIAALKESLRNKQPLAEVTVKDVIEKLQALSDDHHRMFQAIADINMKIWYHISSSDENAKRRENE